MPPRRQLLTFFNLQLTIDLSNVNIAFDLVNNRKALIMNNNKLTQTVFIGLFAALIAVCSQIQIPGAVPFTLQTFAVFLAVGLLGGKRGTVSVLIYILLGAIGLPVFAGFKGGIGALLGTTGGYIIGFIFSALVMLAFEKISVKGKVKKMILLGISMVAGLIVCYAFGTAWFMTVYTNTKEPIGIATALSWCVIPFIIPDIIKIALALTLTSRLKRFIPFE